MHLLNMLLLLTQSSHLFRKVRSEATEQVAAGQQVKGGVAPHRVKGEGVHGTGETRHVTHLVLSVCCHRDTGYWIDVSLDFLLLPRPASLSEPDSECEAVLCHPAPSCSSSVGPQRKKSNLMRKRLAGSPEERSCPRQDWKKGQEHKMVTCWIQIFLRTVGLIFNGSTDLLKQRSMGRFDQLISYLLQTVLQMPSIWTRLCTIQISH